MKTDDLISLLATADPGVDTGALAWRIGLALLGGLVGLALASTLQLFTISTMNWQSFAELAFTFSLDAGIIRGDLLSQLYH